jgi:tetratricopeptide (TPR) repeat protein
MVRVSAGVGTLAGLAFASGWTLLGLLGGGYSLGNAALGVTRLILTAQPETFPNYFWSARHLRDFLNGQLLIGPLGLMLFVPLAIVALRSLRRWSRRTTFFVVLGVGFGAACVAAGDSNLGYARNWDLLAPAGFALTAAALALLLPRLRGRVAETGLLGLALMVSAYHTVPWIALNASLPRSFDRFATLPLELGRVESTIGYWYELRQDPAEAERWFVRALDQNPGNVRAHVFLGHLYSARGQYRLASQAFRYATDLRPTHDDYRLRLVDALVRGGQPEAAVAEVERVLRHQPDNARVWSLYGIVLLGAGRTAAAREAFEHAERAAPASWAYRTLPNYADLPDGYRRALADVWRDLIDA